MLTFQGLITGSSPVGHLPVVFEQVYNELSRLDRLFIEPDGSFVWTGATADGQIWQVDGNLVDQGERLAYVELKGSCPEEQFDRLLSALGWPDVELVFQLQRRGENLDEAEFRRRARTDAGAI
jgi:hypothetical protein